MSRPVIIVAQGTAGDVHPLLAMGRALQERGQQVTVLTNPYFAPVVHRLGLALVPIGSTADFQRAMDDAQLWQPHNSMRALWRHTEQPVIDSWRWLRTQAPRNAVLLASSMALGARVAHDTEGMPLATVHLAPTALLSCRQPPRMGHMPWPSWLPPAAVRAVWSVVEWSKTDHVLAPTLNAMRAEAGLPPVRHILSRYLHSPQCVLLAYPEWFAPDPGDRPPHSVSIGFPRFDEGGQHAWPAGLREFLQAGPPPLLFTPGSAMLHAQNFFKCAVQASQALGQRAIMATPFAQQLPPLPAGMLSVGYVPFSELLPHTAAFAHHGGIGSASQGLAAGVPQLVVANSFDQFDNGAHLQRLGVGELLTDCTPQRMQQALQRLLHTPAVAQACSHWQGQLQQPAVVLDAACRAVLALAEMPR